jgi:hypothetical protein
MSLSLLVAILLLLDFLEQTETIRPEKFSEFADTHRQNYCCACDACWAHISHL